MRVSGMWLSLYHQKKGLLRDEEQRDGIYKDWKHRLAAYGIRPSGSHTHSTTL